ncbi:MAG: hypothetical protein ABIY40_04400 [Rhodanobacteraceae bacterium]|nr:hypothetical protein [Pseudomonadota bacterium]
MKRLPRPSRRTRLRLTLLVVLSLLFQQLALASYVCAAADMPASDAAMIVHCQGMSMAQAKQSPALCTWHCAQQSASTQSTQAPSVPALSFAAPLPSPSLFAALPAARAMNASAPIWRASGIPPEFRFRVLLI